MQLTPDERLTSALPILIKQFPPMIRSMIDLTPNNSERKIRLLVFEAISHLTPKELTVDQITAAQLPELLALAVELNPPAFQPARLTPNTLAEQKAFSYCAAYLMNRFVSGLNMVGNSPQIIEELTTDAGDIMMAQIQRLRFNYNQHFRITDYLADIKARQGILAAITAKQSAVFSSTSSEIMALASQIGQSIGTISAIIHECRQLKADKTWFISNITAGQYPLALLFARETSPDWFNNFFGHPHRPSLERFDQAYRLTLAHFNDVNQIVDDIKAQLMLDVKILPSNRVQKELISLINSI
ncbi:polyprenyl synthetase [uncultured Limosilactobacillus sp.]|uniref:polyprenyl synthetase n=1 Tax=uncultured Limosilactobacillus sp. TaxID=2837629 RepID=UPI00272ADE81|nr:polyprenyl synthetase [uncultured Limosilactobacillus sp.]